METARQPPRQTPSLRREALPFESRSLWHGPAHVLPWSDELLSEFGLRMASHGMSISSTQMRSSPGYALQQLAHAREMDDDMLQLLAVRMFRLFESHRSGVPVGSH